MKKIAVILFSGFCCASIHAQEAPEVVKSIMESKSRLIKRGELSAKHKEFLLKDTTLSDQGYLKVGGLPNYHRIIADTVKIQSFEHFPHDKSVRIKSRIYKLVGQLVESENRKNIVYQAENRNVMMTVWNYKKDGAEITLAEDMFNVDINKNPGTLSLVTSEGSDAMWKLTWKNGDTLFEFYAEDSISKDREPSLSPAQVREEALVILNLNNSRKY